MEDEKYCLFRFISSVGIQRLEVVHPMISVPKNNAKTLNGLLCSLK